jgi:transcriptional regulator with XRE-family HTH domain
VGGNPREQFAAELRRLREASDLSLRELESRTHTSDSSLSRYLSGRSVPPWSVVQALSRVAGQNAEHLRDLWTAAKQWAPAASPSGSDQPPASPRGRRLGRSLLLFALGVAIGVAVGWLAASLGHSHSQPPTSAPSNGPYFTVDLIAAPPGLPPAVFWTDTARCGSAEEYRLVYDLPGEAQLKATGYRVIHADCTVKLFDGIGGTGYGEPLVPDGQTHQLPARIAGRGVGIVAYSCCNGRPVSPAPVLPSMPR